MNVRLFLNFQREELMDKKVDIKGLRLAIQVLRRAEEDYLGSAKTGEEADWAKEALFGMNMSALPHACEALGMDPVAARLKLIEWKAEGLKGDVFDWLEDPASMAKFLAGKEQDFPRLKRMKGGSDEC